MKVLAISDVHVDYRENKDWLFDLCTRDNSRDVLIVAGDLTHDLKLLNQCFFKLSRSFLCVTFVPGNHEMWTLRNKSQNSLQKFQCIKALASDHGVFTAKFQINGIEITPLLGWYDYSFAHPGDQLRKTWMDYQACSWPEDMSDADVTLWFTQKNRISHNVSCHRKISFSHFLPRIDLIPDYVPASFNYLHPVMGSSVIEEQIRLNESDIHIYGHSHINQDTNIDGIRYVNNATGYPREKSFLNRELKCVYETTIELEPELG